MYLLRSYLFWINYRINFEPLEMSHWGKSDDEPQIKLYKMKTCPFKYIENFTTKKENFQIKNYDIFHISAQNIDCGYLFELPQWGSSNEYSQSMFLSKNKKNNVHPCKPQFYYTKCLLTHLCEIIKWILLINHSRKSPFARHKLIFFVHVYLHTQCCRRYH